MADSQARLRELPAVDRLLHDPEIEQVLRNIPRRLVLQAIQELLDQYRALLTGKSGRMKAGGELDLSPQSLAREAARLAEKKATMNIQSLINATGVVLHTNLGRAPLAVSAVEALNTVAQNYNNLELNLDTGNRGSRQDHLETIICDLTGAEAALVLNNNAAAVFLTLNSVAVGLEVVVSRGQLVEIGGSFRIPDIMAASGAKLVEVGTTNKTYLRDYENALNVQSAAILKVHTSNYHMIGFTAAVDTDALVGLAHRHNLIMIEDLGSGVLLDLKNYRLPDEPRVQDSLSAGADLVTFSGDKLLGGPQAGIIVGRSDLVGAIRRNQLARSLRVDKFTLAALEATLRLYYDENDAIKQIPVWRMLTAEPGYLEERARKLSREMAKIFGSKNVSVISGFSKVGGGALPTAELPTSLVAVRFDAENTNPAHYAERLRHARPPVIVRLQQEQMLFDPRTIFEEQDELLLAVLAEHLNNY